MNLPRSTQEIADVIGRKRTLFLISQLPRTYYRDKRRETYLRPEVLLYVPTLARLKPDHNLVHILGWHDAVKLCQFFGGEILKPANCMCLYKNFRDSHITRLLGEGMKPSDIAEWFGVSHRHVKNVQSEIAREETKPAYNDNRAVSKIDCLVA